MYHLLVNPCDSIIYFILGKSRKACCAFFLPPPTHFCCPSLYTFLLQGSKRLDSGIVKDSMFSSPDEVAGKVGVVNSGKKMTDFGARKKHKFDTF